MGEVTQLGVVPIDRTGKPQQNVIEYVETLLARARTGELQSIAAAYVRANGHAANGVAWGERPTDSYPMGTALIMAQYDFAREMETVSVPAGPPAESPPDPA